MLSAVKGAIMVGSRTLVAATLVLLVGIAPADAQRRGGGRARGGAVVGRAVPRGEGRVAPRVYAGARVVRVAPIRFYQPYYRFRPRLSLGVGLSLGYPVRYTSYYGYYDPFYSYPYYPYGYAYPSPYPYSYSYPSAYPAYPAYPPPAYPPATYPPSAYPPSAYPPGSAQPTYPQSGYPPGSPQPVYPQSGYPSGSPQPAYPQSGYPPQGSISPSQPNTGGMSFEIQPSDAQIYVDGRYVGTVGQFSPTSQPLGLTVGRHHVRITAPGYRAMEFDADIVSGEVLPYQGTLER